MGLKEARTSNPFFFLLLCIRGRPPSSPLLKKKKHRQQVIYVCFKSSCALGAIQTSNFVGVSRALTN